MLIGGLRVGCPVIDVMCLGCCLFLVGYMTH